GCVPDDELVAGRPAGEPTRVGGQSAGSGQEALAARDGCFDESSRRGAVDHVHAGQRETAVLAKLKRAGLPLAHLRTSGLRGYHRKVTPKLTALLSVDKDVERSSPTVPPSW